MTSQMRGGGPSLGNSRATCRTSSIGRSSLAFEAEPGNVVIDVGLETSGEGGGETSEKALGLCGGVETPGWSMSEGKAGCRLLSWMESGGVRSTSNDSVATADLKGTAPSMMKVLGLEDSSA